MGQHDAVLHHQGMRAQRLVQAHRTFALRCAEGHVQGEQFQLVVQRQQGMLEAVPAATRHFDQPEAGATAFSGSLGLQAAQEQLLQLRSVQPVQPVQ